MIDRLRLIHDTFRSPSYNMAADEALFLRLSTGESPPTLRFYQWDPPTVSIGYFESAQKDIDLEKIKEQNFGFVRRPTGGRAVLHWKEVTFCLTIPTGGRGLWEIFRTVHEAIGTGLRRGGIPALVLPADREKLFDADGAAVKNASCFASPSRYELTLNGKKITGTAQKQVRDFILIHGSLPLVSTYKILFSLINFPDENMREEAYRKSLRKMTSLLDETGVEYSFDAVRLMIMDGIKTHWNCSLEEGSLSSDEIELIADLEREKYANPDWLLKK